MKGIKQKIITGIVIGAGLIGFLGAQGCNESNTSSKQNITRVIPDCCTYTGNWEDGKPIGQGTMVWSEDGRKYIGNWEDGKPNGQGTMVWLDGSKYVGNWEEGKPMGQGNYHKADGFVASGEFNNNKLINKGYIISPDNGVIKVNFSSGKTYWTGNELEQKFMQNKDIQEKLSMVREERKNAERVINGETTEDFYTQRDKIWEDRAKKRKNLEKAVN